jgi:phage/plasmid-like protein (TIGR03299 family)
MVRKPSWHRLERVVLPDHVTDWDTARKEAGLDWEVYSEPVYNGNFATIPGWRAICRDDKDEVVDVAGDKAAGRVLAIQPESYALIKMAEFGDVIDTCLGKGSGSSTEPVRFEALMSLYGGRKIVALVYFEEPLQISWDPSAQYSYVAFANNHDGQGGLTGIPTTTRVVCANTWRHAEETDGKRVGFTIRHTKNWESRVAEVAAIMAGARKDNEAWLVLGEKLSLYKTGARQREVFLKRFLPQSDDFTDRQVANNEVARDQVRQILASATCEGIAGTGYGLVMAATEWSDHLRSYNSADSYVSRQLLRKEAPKARAFRVVRQMAGIKGS